jgi:hypothetical protein
MNDSAMAGFIAYLNDNPDVRKQVEQLERSIGYAMRQQDESIAAIAVDAGFDVSRSGGRATVGEPPLPEAQAPLCCGILTSDIVLLTEAADS